MLDGPQLQMSARRRFEARTLRKITVFYAWQSDRPQRFNRHLIRIALEAAAKRITLDSEIDAEVHIDSDTQGVPGQPPITDTILKKIAACDIFAPDLTFVASTDETKLVTNPNVSIEYGYALHAKPYTAMMSIMNTAYGPPEKLPFDIGHVRHPLQFHVEPTAKNSERRRVRDALSVQIESALRLMIIDHISRGREQNLFPEATPARPPALFSKAGETIARSRRPGEQEYLFSHDKAFYIRVFPKYGDQPRVGLSAMKAVFDANTPCTMSLNIGGLVGRNTYGPVIIDAIRSDVRSATQGFPSGELWGISAECFRELGRRDEWWPSYRPERYFVIATITLEQVFVRSLNNYINILRDELHLKSPYVVEMGAVGLSGCYLAVPGGDFGRGQEVGPIMEDTFKRRYEINAVDRAADRHSIMRILKEYFVEFYDIAACVRNEVLTEQLVASHRLPPLAE